ncbi:hypothetical protein NCC78_08900 [Micromonospora phytophila]|uniref:hypothetical protein n=1 Tax=Micromonospora phytophila TaxID=709888 RepID=UPI00202E1AD8|nr:hypothetical protein [Micromonospora phytophila]MCM0674806.1 hypothetical protein [Micromonospora phytophila]
MTEVMPGPSVAVFFGARGFTLLTGMDLRDSAPGVGRCSAYAGTCVNRLAVNVSTVAITSAGHLCLVVVCRAVMARW